VVRFPGIKVVPLSAGAIGIAALLAIAGAAIGWFAGRALRWPAAVRSALESAFYTGDAAAALTRTTVAAAALGLDWIERRVVDGALSGFEEAAALAGRAPRRLRFGRAEQGALGLVAGVALVVVIAVLLIAFSAKVTG
jgi:hypothetical protein